MYQEAYEKKREPALFRRMTKQDLEAAALLEQENFTSPWKKEDFEQALLRNDTVYIVAETKEGIVGCCGVRNIAGEGEITNVSVKEGFRNRKIGTGMLKELLREGRSIGIEAFTLEVRSGNETAVAMYGRLGFVTEGVRRGFYTKPAEDALIMWKR